MIGIAGGSGSGKTALSRGLLSRMHSSGVALLCQDYYYFDNAHMPPEERKKKNFDHPDAIDFGMMFRQLHELQQGKVIHHPLYSFHTCTRLPESGTVEPPRILLVEGILILSDPAVRAILDLKLFLDVPETIRLQRIIHRDMAERGRTSTEAIDHFQRIVKPMHEIFVEPSKVHADHILNGLSDTESLCSHVEALSAPFLARFDNKF